MCWTRVRSHSQCFQAWISYFLTWKGLENTLNLPLKFLCEPWGLLYMFDLLKRRYVLSVTCINRQNKSDCGFTYHLLFNWAASWILRSSVATNLCQQLLLAFKIVFRTMLKWILISLRLPAQSPQENRSQKLLADLPSGVRGGTTHLSKSPRHFYL